MTKSLFDRDYVKRQRAFVERELGNKLESINNVFQFDLETLPLQQKPNVSREPTDTRQGLIFDLAVGQTITMTDLVQFSSQAGVIEGIQHPLGSFCDAVARSIQAFPNFQGVPTALPPIVYCSLDTVREQDCWIAVPPVCTVAMFNSSKPARDPGADNSSAILIWFQDDFGIAIGGRTMDQIRSLGWSAIAVDGWL